MQKIALVTGSSKGIGKAIARRLAQENYTVIVTYHTDKAGGEETVKEIEKLGKEAYLCRLDISNETNVQEVMKSIEERYGHLDVLVNNAVRSIDKSIEESSFEEWKLGIDTKLHGAWLATKYALPLLKNSDNANVVFVSSNADDRPSSEILSYAVATGAINTLIKALATHLPSYGIRVNAVMPGQTRTDNWGELKNDDALWQQLAEQNPMKRVTMPEEVADAVLLLINDPHKFFNGNLFYVNGGGHLT